MVALIVVAGIALIQFLFAIWIKGRLEKSIAHEYDNKLEDYRFEIEARRRAENVADYLSRLFADPNAKSPELNATAWQLSLWLPAAVYCDSLLQTVVRPFLKSLFVYSLCVLQTGLEACPASA
ncbi:MAG: hypothetical protein R3F31_25270 [Verrucomicrobiales bacterium]